jgi:serine/threonine kinase 32
MLIPCFAQVDHPFVVNLRYAFQDDENCFFVLDLMLGGDLRCKFILSVCKSSTLTNSTSSSSPPKAAFFRRSHRPLLCCRIIFRPDLSSRTTDYSSVTTAPIFMCLRIQHFVPSDIKPDNILLDAEGHAHLTDFNVASHYSLSKPLTSVAGSMAYIAPEVVARKGYTYTPDWWSLGVTAYELVFGVRPYHGRNGEELMSSVKRGDKPKFFVDPNGKCSPEGIQVLRGVRLFGFGSIACCINFATCFSS